MFGGPFGDGGFAGGPDAAPITPMPWAVQPAWIADDMGSVSDKMAMRGHPVPLGASERRTIPVTPSVPDPTPDFFFAQQYNRGAQAFAPQFGVLPINPIGSGIYAAYRPASITGPGARYEANAIWWTSQMIPTSLRMGPGVPQEVIDALISQGHVSAAYAVA